MLQSTQIAKFSRFRGVSICQLLKLLGLVQFIPKSKKFSRFSVTSNLAANALSIKCRRKQKLITQFVCKSRDKSFDSSQFMIEQYLSNKNESATVAKSVIFSELKEALDILGPCLVSKYFAKSTLQLFRLYLTNIVQSWTNYAQKIRLVNSDQTVQLVFIFVYI